MLRVLVLLMMVGLSFNSFGLNAELDPCLEFAPVEICDNGIDDDGDGLIDLNDDDCICQSSLDSLLVPSSLILNPSFEDTLCCPDHLAQLSCANNWVQASSATSDYFNTCDFTTDKYRTIPPSPLPAGNGYVGFRDEINYKEYVGTCLSDYMRFGTPYKLEFYVGFGKDGDFWKSNSPFNLSIYGSEDCANLPFGGPGYVSCPIGLNDWFEIAQVTIKGEDEWVKVSIEFTVPVDVNAFVIGPSCQAPKGENFYYLDDLILAESTAFESNRLNIQGTACDNIITLSGQEYRGVDYQWYHEGIAIIGATNRVYEITDFKQGDYLLRISVMGQCFYSEIYSHSYETFSSSSDTSICKGDVIKWEGISINEAGDYTASYKKTNGCDSTLNLVVKHFEDHYSVLDTSLCLGESVSINNQEYFTAGEYPVVMNNVYGCDSTILLKLNILQDYFIKIDTQLCQGDIIIIDQVVYEESGNFIINMFTINGCDSMVNLVLTVDESSSHRIDTMMCISDVIEIENNSFTKAGDYTIVINNQKGCDSTILIHIDTYKEYFNVIDTNICAYSILEIGNKSWDQTGVYNINEYTVHGCDSITVVRLIVAQDIVSVMQLINPVSCNNNTDASINVDVAGGEGQLSYIWNTGETGNRLDNISSGIYKVTIIDDLGCEQYRSMEVINPDILQAEVISFNPTCNDPMGGKIILGIVEGGTAPYVMSINGEFMDDQAMRTHDFGPGEYEVAIIDQHDCMVTEMISFEEPGLGEIEIITDKVVYVQGELVELSVEMIGINTPITSINWHPKSAFSCSNCEDVETRMFLSFMNVSVEITDENGCVYIRSIELKANSEYFIPNVFTPNNDGINDIFGIYTDSEVTILEFEIFNRWGNLVHAQYDFKSSDKFKFWNGKFKGKDVIPSTYVYRVLLEDHIGGRQQLSGDITLMR